MKRRPCPSFMHLSIRRRMVALPGLPHSLLAYHFPASSLRCSSRRRFCHHRNLLFLPSNNNNPSLRPSRSCSIPLREVWAFYGDLGGVFASSVISAKLPIIFARRGRLRDSCSTLHQSNAATEVTKCTTTREAGLLLPMPITNRRFQRRR